MCECAAIIAIEMLSVNPYASLKRSDQASDVIMRSHILKSLGID